jgi:hypothetical protein
MALPGHCKVLLFLLVLALALPVSANSTGVGNQTAEVTPSLTPVPYAITLFIPSSNMIHSTQIMDLINGFNSTGEVLIATSFGLSTYNGTWSTRHMTHSNISQGLMDDFIITIEYDNKGDLWIGYSGGLQIYNGQYYRTIRDQQLLKETRIKDLLRWNNDMWVATGHSGIHRYRDGVWTWYQPYSVGGPDFYEVNAMEWDHAANATVLVTDTEGLWLIRSQDDPIRFECIAGKYSTYGLLDMVKPDYYGGVLLFNDTTVVHYSPTGNFSPVLTNRDLSITRPPINDLISGPDGKLYLATDQGIYIWDDGRIYRHLDRFEGIGTSSVVQSINIDAEDRIWFSTPDDVGYYIDHPETRDTIQIQMVPSARQENTTPGNKSPGPIPTLREDTVTSSPAISGNTTGNSKPPGTIPTLHEDSPATSPSRSPSTGVGDNVGIVDQIVQQIRSFFLSIGLKPRF